MLYKPIYSKIIPKFLLEAPCAARVFPKTSGYSFFRDKIDKDVALQTERKFFANKAQKLKA